MFNYVKISEGKVVATQSSSNKVFSEDLIEVPAQTASIGDLYENGVFSPPTPEEPIEEVIRLITVGSFKKRFPSSVRKKIREVAVDVGIGMTEELVDSIIDMREDLDAATYIDLDDPDVTIGMQGLLALAWMTQGDVDNQLADGTEREKWNGEL